MPNFYVLRIQREDNPADRSECQVKFFPVFTNKRVPIRITAVDEAAAFAQVARDFPTLRRFLAVQECTSYDHTIAGLLKAKYTRGILGGAANARLGIEVKGANRVSVVAGDSGVSPTGESGTGENPLETQQAV